MYRCYRIKKPRGGFRTITEPSDDLKEVLFFLKEKLDVIPLHDSAHGFVLDRSPITNASIHRQQRYVLNIDIKSFFPSVKKEAMMNSLYGVSHHMSEPDIILPWVEELCFFDGCLPQGSPTSPVLSNIFLTDLDYYFSDYVSIFNGKYSRYADDLTFSGDELIKENFISIIRFVESCLRFKDLKINPKKIKLMPYYQCQKVTGVVVNNEKLTLPGKKKEELFLSLRGFPSKELDAHQLGYLEYIHSVDVKFYEKLMSVMV